MMIVIRCRFCNYTSEIIEDSLRDISITCPKCRQELFFEGYKEGNPLCPSCQTEGAHIRSDYYVCRNCGSLWKKTGKAPPVKVLEPVFTIKEARCSSCSNTGKCLSLRNGEKFCLSCSISKGFISGNKIIYEKIGEYVGYYKPTVDEIYVCETVGFFDRITGDTPNCLWRCNKCSWLYFCAVCGKENCSWIGGYMVIYDPKTLKICYPCCEELQLYTVDKREFHYVDRANLRQLIFKLRDKQRKGEI